MRLRSCYAHWCADSAWVESRADLLRVAEGKRLGDERWGSRRVWFHRLCNRAYYRVVSFSLHMTTVKKWQMHNPKGCTIIH